MTEQLNWTEVFDRGVFVILRALLNSDQLHFKCSVDACGQRSMGRSNDHHPPAPTRLRAISFLPSPSTYLLSSSTKSLDNSLSNHCLPQCQPQLKYHQYFAYQWLLHPQIGFFAFALTLSISCHWTPDVSAKTQLPFLPPPIWIFHSSHCLHWHN